MDKRTREQLRAIEREGLTVLRVEPQGNTHLRVYVNVGVNTPGVGAVNDEQYIVIPTSSGMDATGAAHVAAKKARLLLRGGGFKL
jgi:hypothetical protein